MNKSELIDAVAASADLPKAAAGRALDAVLGAITDALKEGDTVIIGWFWYLFCKRACSTYWP